MSSSGKIIFFLFSSFILIGIIFVWFVKFPSIQAQGIIISPLGSEKTVPTPVDSLFEKVTNRETIDNLNTNEYFPKSLGMESSDDLDLEVESYIAFDRESRKILLGKNITRKLPIASLTKIATAIAALENGDLDRELVVSSASANIGEATMGLTAGEKITVEEALYGLMLPSGNDAAETLAEGLGKYDLGTPQEETDGGGARAWFMQKMNEKVQSLGLFDSYFFNPSGLDGEDIENTNFSTVLDMAVLTNYALSNRTFSQVVDTREKVFDYKARYHKAFYLYNILSFEGSYPGIKGVKPGISIFADETLASYNEKDGRRIIVILLGSKHTKDDVVKIYDKIFGVEK
ncbi:D-alanyl-D-alanine carboxypeptidase [Candidatus Gottesmanbacteria bacterium]|nr:D-alanyl-D-alanine carboxypeptidase [Candidatus Gottesmanbacteria bacterium]